MTDQNGSASNPGPVQKSPDIVEPEFLVTHLVQRLRNERDALNTRINDLLVENTLKSAYIDQLKAKLKNEMNVEVPDITEAEKAEFLEQNS